MLSSQEILDILPHRYPFLMVDGVAEIDEERILAYKNVSHNEPHFAGHFPGHPVMPGVLIVEAMAQAGGVLAHHCGAFDPEKQLIMFMTISSAKFRRVVRPGDKLDLEVVPLRKGKFWKLKGKATVAGELAAEAEFLATIQPRA